MRKIIQIACEPNGLYALCNDGTLWSNDGGKWELEDPIPQDEVVEIPQITTGETRG